MLRVLEVFIDMSFGSSFSIYIGFLCIFADLVVVPELRVPPFLEFLQILVELLMLSLLYYLILKTAQIEIKFQTTMLVVSLNIFLIYIG